MTSKGWLLLIANIIATIFYFENKDLEIKEVKKGLMHHMKEVTALQKQMTAVVNIVLVFKWLIIVTVEHFLSQLKIKPKPRVTHLHAFTKVLMFENVQYIKYAIG